MSDLQNKIAELISLNKEGEYWDFKLKHHENPVDLVLDIICLANTVRHKGNRFLILGVDPISYEIKGLEETTPVRTQADIITTLRNAGFANQSFPDITLENVCVASHTLHVVVISDKHQKPYYLGKDYAKNGTLIRAGVVYSRTADTNTPKDSTATPNDIELMWQERFGLTLPIFERFKIYLKDHKSWNAEEYVSYYTLMPEFSIRCDDADYSLDYTQEWTRGEIGSHYASGNNAHYMNACYHQTVIAKIHLVGFDGGKKHIVAPDWSPYGSGRIYYYLQDSLEYAYQMHLAGRYGEDHSQQICYTSGNYLNTFSIPLFRDKGDLASFISYAQKPATDRSETNKEEQTKIFYEALEAYNRFRASGAVGSGEVTT
ncbi:MAG: putative DNA binding domain-containing protein [Alphaproteobacteria bacterium]|nr:putative DNA binding domain-containing protein [Alphaproteobacteria bacterium]